MLPCNDLLWSIENQIMASWLLIGMVGLLVLFGLFKLIMGAINEDDDDKDDDKLL